MAHRIVVPVPPGAPLFELAVPCEVFGIDRSDIVADWYDFQLCPINPGPTALPHGLVLTGGGTLDDVAAADTVIVPAWADPAEEPPPELLDALRAAHDRGAPGPADDSGRPGAAGRHEPAHVRPRVRGGGRHHPHALAHPPPGRCRAGAARDHRPVRRADRHPGRVRLRCHAARPVHPGR